MKNIILTLAIMFVANSASAQWSNDLYGNPVPSKKKQAQATSYGNSKQNKTYTSSSSNNSSSGYMSDNYQSNDDGELVTSYEQALRRRYNAMRNATYEQPESYWHLMEQYQSMLEKKYNQNLYNIVVVGDEMWVEPQSITAQFDGSDPAAGVIQYNQEIRSGVSNKNYSSNNNRPNITIEINVVDPWDTWGYSSWIWNRPYYYSSYYWGRPYWGGGYYPPYWGGGYYPPYLGGGYHNNDYHNPKGTYYGNSRYNNSNRPGYYGSNSRPGYSSGGSSMGGGRPSRPNGSNTIYGGIGRPSRNSGSVVANRPGVPSFTRLSNSGRPSSNNYRPGSTTRPNVERPRYERSNSNTERKVTTYERPTSTVSRPVTINRSSGSSSGSNGGGSRSNGGLGGGRPTRR